MAHTFSRQYFVGLIAECFWLRYFSAREKNKKKTKIIREKLTQNYFLHGV